MIMCHVVLEFLDHHEERHPLIVTEQLCLVCAIHKNVLYWQQRYTLRTFNLGDKNMMFSTPLLVPSPATTRFNLYLTTSVSWFLSHATKE
jgi:hypothetical protein